MTLTVGVAVAGGDPKERLSLAVTPPVFLRVVNPCAAAMSDRAGPRDKTRCSTHCCCSGVKTGEGACSLGSGLTGFCCHNARCNRMPNHLRRRTELSGRGDMQSLVHCARVCQLTWLHTCSCYNRLTGITRTSLMFNHTFSPHTERRVGFYIVV